MRRKGRIRFMMHHVRLATPRGALVSIIEIRGTLEA